MSTVQCTVGSSVVVILCYVATVQQLSSVEPACLSALVCWVHFCTAMRYRSTIAEELIGAQSCVLQCNIQLQCAIRSAIGAELSGAQTCMSQNTLKQHWKWPVGFRTMLMKEIMTNI